MVTMVFFIGEILPDILLFTFIDMYTNFFNRFGIEAITLEGYEKEGRGIYSSVFQVGR